MSKISLTKRAIDSLKPSGLRDAYYWDDKLSGFGLRIKPSGKKSFVIQYRNKSRRSRRYTIGQYGRWTPDESRREARRLFGVIESGGDPAHDREHRLSAKTMKELAEEYLDKCERGLILTKFGKEKKKSTITTDRSRIERHIIPLLGDLPIDAVTSADVRKFQEDITKGKTAGAYKARKERGRSIVRGGHGAATRTVGLLGGILSYAVDMGYRADNPTAKVKRHKDGVRTRRLNPDEYHRFENAISHAESNGEHWQVTVCARLIALTGMRRGEAIGLKRAEVELADRVARLENTKTGPSVRPLSDKAIDLLDVALSKSTSIYVFPGLRPQCQHFGGFPKAWNRIVRRVLPDITPHTLRHSFVSVADEQGLTESTIGALVGHGRSTVTSRYIHKCDSVLLDAANRVGHRIAEMMGGV